MPKIKGSLTKKSTKTAYLKELKAIEKQISNLGYNTEMDHYDDNIIFTNKDLSKGEDEVFRISCDVYDMSTCCGITEVGNFEVSDRKVTGRLKKAAVLGIRYLFLHIKNEKTDKTSRKPVIFASNNSGACILFEEAMKGFEHYACVSISKNPNSKNTIKLYVSTP